MYPLAALAKFFCFLYISYRFWKAKIQFSFKHWICWKVCDIGCISFSFALLWNCFWSMYQIFKGWRVWMTSITRIEGMKSFYFYNEMRVIHLYFFNFNRQRNTESINSSRFIFCQFVDSFYLQQLNSAPICGLISFSQIFPLKFSKDEKFSELFFFLSPFCCATRKRQNYRNNASAMGIKIWSIKIFVNYSVFSYFPYSRIADSTLVKGVTVKSDTFRVQTEGEKAISTEISQVEKSLHFQQNKSWTIFIQSIDKESLSALVIKPYFIYCLIGRQTACQPQTSIQIFLRHILNIVNSH